MSLFSQLLAVAVLVLLFILILYVVFGQVTVRKLRKNPETKTALGFQYASGTDISNVVKILAISKSKAEKLRAGRMSFLYADKDLLTKHTNKVDRVLAKIVYWLMLLWCCAMAVLMIAYFIVMLD